ncbi:MAG TPA: DUF4124 domain-containing protein [Usitatibacter sp.]|nr:DUF4124 domain-containing protein [Usitatibacter sp.]HXS51366.1 DUF4124 domain-containing protein [Usitatibacter sp.]
MSRARASLAAAALALAAMPVHAINKCVDHHGKVSYQNAPCPESSKEEKVTVMPGPAPSAPQAAATAKSASAYGPTGLLRSDQDGADPRMDSVVSTLSTYEGCETASPQFAQANRAKYSAWRSDNAELLDRLPHSSRYMKLLRIQRAHVQNQLADPGARKAYAGSCESKLDPVLSPAKPAK